MLKAFISYAHEDKLIAHTIDNILECNGYDSWFDKKPRQGIIAGDDISDVIAQEIEKRDVLIVVWSAFASKSTWVLKEIKFADSRGKRVIFCNTDDTNEPFGFVGKRHVKYSESDDFDSKLLDELKMLAENPPQRDVLEPDFSEVIVGGVKLFDIGTTLVTIGQFKSAFGENYDYKRDAFKFPIYRVTYDKATEYCEKLSSHFKRTYALPTVKQWILAASGGNNLEYATKDGKFTTRINCDCEDGSRRDRTIAYDGVKNVFEIIDMSGNLWEWTQTRYDPLEDYYIVKGGSWIDRPENCKISAQHAFHREHANLYTGFRIVRLP